MDTKWREPFASAEHDLGAEAAEAQLSFDDPGWACDASGDVAEAVYACRPGCDRLDDAGAPSEPGCSGRAPHVDVRAGRASNSGLARRRLS